MANLSRLSCIVFVLCFFLANFSRFAGTEIYLEIYYEIYSEIQEQIIKKIFKHILKYILKFILKYIQKYIKRYILPCTHILDFERYLCECTLGLGESSKETTTMQLQRKFSEKFRANISCSATHPPKDKVTVATHGPHHNISPHTKTVFNRTPENLNCYCLL